jgi:predicted dehydrogenase
LSEILADDAVAGVAITTQAWMHAELAIQAMKAGKDVFVEKPLALSYEAGQRVVELAECSSSIFMVGHLLEYHPALLRLVELVRGDELGKLQYIYSNRLNLGKFRREENILWSFAPHDIAIILRLVGESPIEVMATGGAYLQPNVADTTVTNLLFDNGLRAHIFVSWLHPYKEQRLVVVGSKKMAVFDDRAVPGEKLVVYDKGADWVNNQPVPRQGDGTPVSYEGSEPLRMEMEHFLECMGTRQQPRTDGRSGLRVLQVLQAAQQSLQMGGSRVPLWQAPRMQLASL